MTLVIILFFILAIITEAAGRGTPSSKSLSKPTFISADLVEYDARQDVIYARGNIKVSMESYILTGNSVVYDIKSDLMWAEGNITLQEDKKLVVIGERAFLKNKLKEGVISDFIASFGDNNLLVARLAEKIPGNKAVLDRCSFTSCRIPASSTPIWQVSAKKTYVDFDKQKITYKNLFFEIYGVPVLFTPYFAHPTPGAGAQSGILMPEIKRDNIRIPIYYRAKNYLDFTLTPRFNKDNIIYEIEARHKTKYGYHITEGSYGALPYLVAGEPVKTIPRYHLFTKADFEKQGYHYGFNIKRTSDKAYLKNYYDRFDNYLASEVYFNRASGYNYLSTKGAYFQDMKVGDAAGTNPLVFPKIKTKNVIDLSDSGLYLVLGTNSLTYKQSQGKELGKTSITTELSNELLSKGGHAGTFTMRNRLDYYYISSLPERLDRNKTLSRTIPELEASWRYPLVGRALAHYKIIVEPMAQGILGQSHSKKSNKFALIDANRYELSEHNLFSSNRYSGTDYHEFGRRLNYGVQTTTSNGRNYIGVFIGQSLSQNNNPIIRNREIVGRVNFMRDRHLELFYRYRKTEHFKPIRDEFGANFWHRRFKGEVGAIKLTNLRKYYFLDNLNLPKNQLEQVYSKFEYYLSSNWTIGSEAHFDISKKRTAPIYNNLSVTYYKDCIGFTARISKDYTSDPSRGIKKNLQNYSFTLRLKSINM